MRAVPVRVNEVVGVAGFVVPGMRVDVLISGSRPNGDSAMGTITWTLLQNLEVLSAGTDFKKDPEGKPVQVQVINLLVTPEQAELLSLASAQTQIQLVLRNPLDRDVTKTPGTALALLFNGGRLKAESDPSPAKPRAPRVASVGPKLPVMPMVALPAPKKEEPFVMEIISGAKKAEQKFMGSGEGK
jgi:pilus assembly protein CpaB